MSQNPMGYNEFDWITPEALRESLKSFTAKNYSGTTRLMTLAISIATSNEPELATMCAEIILRKGSPSTKAYMLVNSGICLGINMALKHLEKEKQKESKDGR